MSYRLLHVLSVLVLLGCGVRAPAEAPPLGWVTFEWQAERQWIGGMPVWVSVTVTPPEKATLSGPHPESRPFDFHSVTWRLTRRGEAEPVASRLEAPVGHTDFGFRAGPHGEVMAVPIMPPNVRIEDGRPVRFLACLPMPDVPLDAGIYTLTVRLHDTMGLAIGPEQQLELELIAPDNERKIERWPRDGLHRVRIPSAMQVTDVPEHLARHSGAIFELAVHRLATGKPLSDALRQRLAEAPPLFAPEVKLLAWWSQALVDRAAADAMEAALRDEHPALNWRIDAIEQWIARGEFDASIRLSVPEEAVIGLPLVASYYVRGAVKLPLASPWGEVNPLDTTIASDHMTLHYPRVTHYRDHARPPIWVRDDDGRGVHKMDEFQVPALTIRAGQGVTFAIDLSSRATVIENRLWRLTDADIATRIAPGNYKVKVAFDELVSEQSLRLHAPNATEQRLLAFVREKHRALADRNNALHEPFWPCAVIHWPELAATVDLDALSPTGARQLAIYRLLGEAVHDGRPVAQLELNPSIVEQVPHHDGAILAVIQYEIAIAAGRKREAADLRDQLVGHAQWHGLNNQIADTGAGMIRYYRDAVSRLKSESGD